MTGPRPNVVVISVDTLRADYLSPEHMPACWAWVERSAVRYGNAYASSTWTKPSHATILTGLAPREHGVEYDDSVVGPEVLTISDMLRGDGYLSFGFTGAGYVGRGAGFAHGFDLFVEVHNEPGPEYLERLLEPLGRSQSVLSKRRREPVFALVHTYFVHEYAIERPDFADHHFASRDRWDAYRLRKVHGFNSPEHAPRVRALYAARVREFDAHLASYLRWLERSPLADNLCVVLTADHGEGLFEAHGARWVYGHGGPPYPEVTRVPLALAGFGVGRQDALVSLKDLAAMVVTIAREGRLPLPVNETVEAEFLTRQRDRARKTRFTATVRTDQTWTLSQADGRSLDDGRAVPTPSKEDLEQLRLLGYLSAAEPGTPPAAATVPAPGASRDR